MKLFFASLLLASTLAFAQAPIQIGVESTQGQVTVWPTYFKAPLAQIFDVPVAESPTWVLLFMRTDDPFATAFVLKYSYRNQAGTVETVTVEIPRSADNGLNKYVNGYLIQVDYRKLLSFSVQETKPAATFAVQ